MCVFFSQIPIFESLHRECPQEFIEKATEIITNFARKVDSDLNLLGLCDVENRKNWTAFVKQINKKPLDITTIEGKFPLQQCLFDFIADFANWDCSTVPLFLETARNLVNAAYNEKPLVADPFAGGGSIPLEALRVGADAFASDLNPVAVLLNKVVLEYIPKYGQKLADAVRKYGEQIKKEAEKELQQFYPKDPDGATPIAYLWARTIKCEGPACGAEIPLMRSMYLAKKSNRSIGLIIKPNKDKTGIDFQIANPFDPKVNGIIADGTVKRANAICPCCGYTTPAISVRKQLKERKGGANDAKLLCVVTTKSDQQGRFYRLPTESDYNAVKAAEIELKKRIKNHKENLSLVPDEPTPAGGGRGAGRAFSQRNYGMNQFCDLFSSRQLLALTTLSRLVRNLERIAVVPTASETAVTRCSRDDCDPVRNAVIPTASEIAVTGCSRDDCDPTVKSYHSRGYLPHIENKTYQFITFHLFDSVPAEIIQRYKREIELEQIRNAVVSTASVTQKCGRKDHVPCDSNFSLSKILQKIGEYEDAGHGACFLKDHRIAQLVKNALFYFDDKHYKIIEWCIMPNHVHVLIEVFPNHSLSKILHSWKSFTAHEANKILNRKGDFWMKEYFDRYIRDEKHLGEAIYYIRNNPVKAGLDNWQWVGNTERIAVVPTASGLDDSDFDEAVKTCLAFAVNKVADINSALCTWRASSENIDHTFGRQAIPVVWDFCEGVSTSEQGGCFENRIRGINELLESDICKNSSGNCVLSSATHHPLPNASVQLLFTDPPYYDAIPYADLSDFFLVWLKRSIPNFFYKESLSPKNEECVVDEVKGHDKQYFETTMKQAMIEGRRILSDEGRCVVVFAHKSTTGWETQLQAMIVAGWVITASWSIDTEMETRLRAMDSAALASSIHLVCRPRIGEPIGEWREVMDELPKRISLWLPRLAKEGVVGADAIFACLGPALEIFSQYSQVEKANGDVVTLREYLEVVWGVISKEALSMIFEDADASGLEENARLTCIWLWMLFGPSDNNVDKISIDEVEDIDEITSEDDNDETVSNTKTTKTKTTGFSLEFDAARKLAQGLGVHLETLNSLVQIKGSMAKLYAVEERVQFLFRKSLEDVANAKQPENSKTRTSSGKKQTKQATNLFDAVGGLPDMPENADAPLAFAPGTTVLDRIHQCMLLFGAGRSDAVRRFLVNEKHGNDVRFWKLAQSLSALYPRNSTEKRWLDGVLAKKKMLGF